MSSGGDDAPHEEHEEHANHEAWVIPYADLLTLVMAMFIALFAISSVNKDKAKEMAAGFNQSISGKPLTGLFTNSSNSSKSLIEGNGGSGDGNGSRGQIAPGQNASSKSILQSLLDKATSIEAAKAQQRQSLEGVEKAIKRAAVRLGVADKLSFEMQERGLVVRVVTDQVLFDTGDARLKPRGAQILQLVGEALRSVDNPLFIEGHTDNTPISTATYPSNWELSTSRAGAVLRFLVDSVGLDVHRMRPSGWADLHPIASNATAVGRARNRRVEIVVESKVIDRVLSGNALTDKLLTKPASPADPRISQIVPDLSK
jgi:chemotaxis protein MotB